jgi:hypothetical protein
MPRPFGKRLSDAGRRCVSDMRARVVVRELLA